MNKIFWELVFIAVIGCGIHKTLADIAHITSLAIQGERPQIQTMREVVEPTGVAVTELDGIKYYCTVGKHGEVYVGPMVPYVGIDEEARTIRE